MARMKFVHLALTSTLTFVGATWKQQSLYSLVHYPFTLKLLWAPVIDVLFVRRQTWLLPIQSLMGILLIGNSFFLPSGIETIHMLPLAINFFILLFLIASQDICVDGWTLTLFSTSNVVWQSMSQTVGQTLGRFVGSSLLLTLESANFTNRYIRQPFGIAPIDRGLFTLSQFCFFWGIAFLVVTLLVALFFREKSAVQSQSFTLWQTYVVILTLLKKKCLLQLASILLLSPIGYSATYFMTNIALIRWEN
jgi:MFS transporter, PAT family, solute carrier family 33 (acetyl-CoA transportor), member 1